ncbi:MAG TPA: endolytic transglycosylase MltG [archaeon]|nr:endolytic transglycosylase MltG [archaeon]
MEKSPRNESSWLSLWPVFLLFFLTNTFFLAFFYVTLAPGRQDTAELNIPAGATLHEIAGLLVEQRVVKSRQSFELLCKLLGLDKSLRAGHYVIPPGTTPWKAISLLTTGQGELVRVTIPEGLTSKQIIQRISSALGGLDPERLSRLAGSDSLVRSLSINSPSMMGYLFPDTYFLPNTMDEIGILTLMAERFNQVYEELVRNDPPENNLSRHETVILASIIEKEAVADRERPLISSVFLNRLALDRPLESCATVLFVLDKHKSRLLYRDLEIDSPYNTYLHRGLPPGPICNPGRASLYAALYPADTNYLYFVARGDGTHVFSRSLDDHNKAKRRFQRSGPSG